MKVKLKRPVEAIHGPKKAGEIIEHQDAWKLVHIGIAEAVDEEAIQKSEPGRKEQEETRRKQVEKKLASRAQKQAAAEQVKAEAEAKRLEEFEETLKAP